MTRLSGMRMWMTILVISTQKLPSPSVLTLIKPRIKANNTAMPVAAETKFCTVKPSAWVR